MKNNNKLNASAEQTTHGINFLQINLGHRLWAHEALMAWLHKEENSWILCIQEPYFSKRGITKLPKEYGAFWDDTNQNQSKNGNSRAVIIAPRNENGYMVSQHSNSDLVTVRFESLGISVVSGYFASELDIVKSIELLLLEVQKRKKVVCCLDVNAYHPRWGSNLKRNLGWRGRKRGEKLIEIIDDNNLFICNKIPHIATFIRDSVEKDESHIDISLCTYDLFNQIEEWTVVDETFMSDHRMIKFKYEGCMQERKGNSGQVICGVPWKKPCKKMECIMEKALLEAVKGAVTLSTTGDVDCFIKKHSEKIKQVLEQVFRKKNKRVRQVFWWTKEVAEVYKKLRKARRRMRTYKYQNLKEEFVECRKTFREVVQKAKLEAWKVFTSEISDPWNKLIKIIKTSSTGKILSRTLHDLSGIYAADISETLVILGRQFFPEPDVKMEYHLNIERAVESALEVYQKGPDITLCELRAAMKQMTSTTAPGFDEITNNVLKCLVKNTNIERTYLNMFNVCLENAWFPAIWKEAKVVLIPKPSTESNSTKAFRPISLTSSFSKLFERIVLARILHYLNLSKKLVCNQHAYQKGRSTLTALYELFEVVQYALHRRGGEKSVCIIVFLDITGAFDRTWHFGILHKLLEYEVPAYLVAWIRNFLSERKAFFMDNDVTHEVNLAQGCPQGGVLSPILWNVLFNEMLSIPTDTGKKRHNRLKVIGYADDAALVCKAGTAEEASHLLNLHLKKIHEWSGKYRIKFNPSKLAVLSISNRLGKSVPASIFYDDILIKEVSEYKYLGLLVDNKCSWKQHINSVLEKLSLVTRSLRGLSRANWGINLDVYRMLFHAIFMPIMTYGIAIWGWKATHKNVCAKFDKQIRNFGLLATRCLKSTSSSYIFSLLNTPDFGKILQFQVLKTSVQQFHIIQTKRKSVYDNYCSKRMVREVPQCIDHHYYMCRKTVGGILCNPDKIEFDDVNIMFNTHPSKWIQTDVRIDDFLNAIWKGSDTRGWVLYTDASRSTHGVGWGFAVFQNGFCVYRSSGALSECSIFKAEAYAVLQATLYITNSIEANQMKCIEIRTDSQGLVRALEKDYLTEQLLVEIKTKLRDLKILGKRVCIAWVPSHNDIYGNEVADRLAKKATDNSFQVQMAITNRDIKQFLKEKERLGRSMSWSSFQSRNVKFFLPDIESVQQFLRSKPSVSLCQIVSGHTRLNDFVYEKLGLIKSPQCACKKAKETISHFLLECNLYDDIRKEIWPDFESSYAYILKDWKLLDRYVKMTKRFSLSIRDALRVQSV